MFEVLTAAFGDANRKQNARTVYRSLRRGDRDFSSFWAEFQRLGADLDHSEETLIDDLLHKAHYTIQQQLATGDEDPTVLPEVESLLVTYMDNLFTSANIFRVLRQKGIDACCITRPLHSEQFPPILSALKDERLVIKLPCGTLMPVTSKLSYEM